MTKGSRTKKTSEKSRREALVSHLLEIVELGHRVLPYRPGSDEPSTSSCRKFVVRDPTDEEIRTMAEPEASALGMVLAWDIVAIVSRVDDDRVGKVIEDAFGDLLKELPMSRDGEHQTIFFRLPEFDSHRMVFRPRSGQDEEGPAAVTIHGVGSFVDIPSPQDPPDGPASAWTNPATAIDTIEPEEVPEWTWAAMDGLLEKLAQLDLDCVDIPFPDELFGLGKDLAVQAKWRVDEWFPLLDLPETERFAQGNWIAADSLGLSSPKWARKASRNGLTLRIRVSCYGTRIPGRRNHDPIDLVAAARGVSRRRAEAWLRYRLGIGRGIGWNIPVHERILVNLREVGVQTRFNLRDRCPEVRGGIWTNDWRRMNDHHLAWLQTALPERMIPKAELAPALRAIWCGREVDPLRDAFDLLPKWDGKERIRRIFTSLFQVSCSPDYAVAVFRSFMSSIMWMAYRPGHVHDRLPILIGGEGQARTALLRGLCPEPAMFTSSIPFTGNGRKPLASMHGKMIAEICLHTIGEASSATLHAVLSSDTAHPRMPVPGGPDDFPRLCGLIGTANDFRSLGTHLTSSPAMWPIPIEPGKSALRVQECVSGQWAQLWAEVRHDHSRGISSMDIPRKMLKVREQVVEGILEEADLLRSRIARYVRESGPGSRFTSEELLVDIGSRVDRASQMRVAACLKREHGFGEAVQESYNGERRKVWTVPEGI